ncbi:MAG: prepilin-type N-terminal cleavage/methylation domain-containing protein [Planctomycetota bacterium]
MRRAFTMVELIVVVIVMTVVAATIIPRFSGNEARAAEQEARNVKEFFSSVGARAVLTSQSLQVEYNSLTRQFVMKTARATSDPANFASEREWLPDPLLAPVKLEHVNVRTISADGLPGDVVNFLIELPVGRPRPALVVILGQSNTGETGAWRVELPPEGVEAIFAKTDPLDAAMPSTGTSQDLDASGMGDTPW